MSVSNPSGGSRFVSLTRNEFTTFNARLSTHSNRQIKNSNRQPGVWVSNYDCCFWCVVLFTHLVRTKHQWVDLDGA